MEAKEMRIGNYYDHNGEVLQVTPNVIREVWEAKRTWCKPIPLTEEILVMLGFSFVYEAGGWCNKNHIIYKLKVGWEINPFCTNDEDCNIKLNYVHQLQNLEFALTGLELTQAGGV